MASDISRDESLVQMPECSVVRIHSLIRVAHEPALKFPDGFHGRLVRDSINRHTCRQWRRYFRQQNLYGLHVIRKVLGGRCTDGPSKCDYAHWNCLTCADCALVLLIPASHRPLLVNLAPNALHRFTL